ncbi:MAG: RNA polymerase sigma factor [Limisphaerales bacterium]
MPRDKEQIEDETLTIRAIRGQGEALDRLLSRWQKRIWNYQFGLCRDEQAAWDLLQETCLSVAGGIQKLKDPALFAPWMFRLAHRCYVDWVRKDVRNGEAKARVAEEMETSRSNGSDRLGQIRAAIEQLEPEDRAVITLTYVQGFSYDDIATALELPVGTVKSRIHYAKQKVRELIEKES